LSTRIWISISDLDLNSIIESHNENLKNLVNFIIIIKMANGFQMEWGNAGAKGEISKKDPLFKLNVIWGKLRF